MSIQSDLALCIFCLSERNASGKPNVSHGSTLDCLNSFRDQSTGSIARFFGDRVPRNHPCNFINAVIR